MGQTGWAENQAWPPFEERADRLSPSIGQIAVILTLAGGLTTALAVEAALTGVLLVLAFQIAFIACSAWRVALTVASQSPPPDAPVPDRLPRYTVLAALLNEAEILPQLVQRLSRIDYPVAKLEGFLLLEQDDHATLAAAQALSLPAWLQVVVVPEGTPRTKPRALNIGLARATGSLLTVYDAEDDPDPLQLREAAARFAADDEGRLWALQAPLRVRCSADSRTRFLDRQFAVEYASLFEVVLPGLARLGLPFPLGGTSNHFRASALRRVGGWDAHNVTEDADLGFRLWRAGGRLDVLTRPTHEPPPGAIQDWLPQRARWLKGFMQTWGVHTRDVRGLGWRGGIALTMTLGTALAAASIHAVSVSWVIATVAIAMAMGMVPDTPRFAMGVLLLGTASAWLNGLIGARRAGVPYTGLDMLMAPAYWSLTSLAFAHAAWRLVREPFAWDKTAHRPEPLLDTPAQAQPETQPAGREAA